jgi:hypothetical protein
VVHSHQPCACADSIDKLVRSAAPRQRQGGTKAAFASMVYCDASMDGQHAFPGGWTLQDSSAGS